MSERGFRVESRRCGFTATERRTGNRGGGDEGGKRVWPSVAAWDSRWPTVWACQGVWALFCNGEGATEEHQG